MSTAKRKRLSVAEKAGIIEKSKKFSGSKNQFAKSLGLSSSTLSSILKQQSVLETKSNLLGNVAKDRKTLKNSPYDELEKVLVDWIHRARAAKFPVNGAILRKKALDIASDLEMTGFTASNGWVDRFKKRHNLSLLHSVDRDEEPAGAATDPVVEKECVSSEKLQFPDSWLKMANKRKRLSVAEKRNIIELYREFRGTKNELAKSLGLPASTLGSILKQQTALETKSLLFGNGGEDRKTLKTSPYDELEKVLVEWIYHARATNLPINGTILKEKALEISSHLNVKGFTASNGWIDRFKKRYGLIRGGSADRPVEIECVPEQLQYIHPSDGCGTGLNGYPPECGNDSIISEVQRIAALKEIPYKSDKCHAGISEPVPSFEEALNGLELLRRYFEAHERQEGNLKESLSVLRNAVFDVKSKQKKDENPSSEDELEKSN